MTTQEAQEYITKAYFATARANGKLTLAMIKGFDNLEQAKEVDADIMTAANSIQAVVNYLRGATGNK